jgi:hypothetical protein
VRSFYYPCQNMRSFYYPLKKNMRYFLLPISKSCVLFAPLCIYHFITNLRASEPQHTTLQIITTK